MSQSIEVLRESARKHVQMQQRILSRKTLSGFVQVCFQMLASAELWNAHRIAGLLELVAGCQPEPHGALVDWVQERMKDVCSVCSGMRGAGSFRKMQQAMTACVEQLRGHVFQSAAGTPWLPLVQSLSMLSGSGRGGSSSSSSRSCMRTC